MSIARRIPLQATTRAEQAYIGATTQRQGYDTGGARLFIANFLVVSTSVATTTVSTYCLHSDAAALSSISAITHGEPAWLL